MSSNFETENLLCIDTSKQIKATTTSQNSMPKVAVQTKITSVQQLRVQYGFLLVVRGGGGPHAGRWYEYLNPLHRDVAL